MTKTVTNESGQQAGFPLTGCKEPPAADKTPLKGRFCNLEPIDTDLHAEQLFDTDWFSIIDSEWPQLEKAFQKWLDPDNFSQDGEQKTSMSELTGKISDS